jgi:mono/diheme cytochrome c family protein
MTRITIISAVAFALVGLALPSVALADGDAEAGQAIYLQNCASCHGDQGKGDGPTGMALPVKPRDFSTGEFKFDTDGDGQTGTPADITNVIKKGAMAYGGSPLMAPLPQLTDQQIADIIAFVMTLQNQN